MQQPMVRILSIAALFPLLLTYGLGHAQPKIPPRYKASPMYVAQLPKFCWPQYVDGFYGGTSFSIPPSCGSGMNHFCPALVFMMQAQDPSVPQNERRGAMGNAVTEINYTLREMTPNCPIAADVKAAEQKAKLLSTIIK